MHICFDSDTGNVKSFVSKLQKSLIESGVDLKSTHIEWGDEEINCNQSVIYITRTMGAGEITPEASEFLEINSHLVVAVACSGSKGFGDNFGKAGDLIFDKYGIPYIHKFEDQGSFEDVEFVCDWILNYLKSR